MSGARVVERVDVDSVEAEGLALGHRGPDRLCDRPSDATAVEAVFVVNRIELRRGHLVVCTTVVLYDVVVRIEEGLERLGLRVVTDAVFFGSSLLPPTRYLRTVGTCAER